MLLVFMPVTGILGGFLTIIVGMFYCIPSEMLSLGLTHLLVFFQKDVKAINSSLICNKLMIIMKEVYSVRLKTVCLKIVSLNVL